jgi:hypothetical protein
VQGEETMKEKLRFTLSALIWTVVLLAAYALTAHAQTTATVDRQAATKKGNVTQAAGPNLPVLGSGTVGQLTKWTGLSSSNSFIGNSIITEDKLGQIGIGTMTPTSKLTVQGMIETTLGGYKFPDGSLQTTAFDPNQVVRSLNGLHGDLSLTAGTNITVTPSGGNTLTIAAPNVLTSVFHNATLTGNGTIPSPLGIADGGVGTVQLANSAVTAAKIAPGSVVKELNGLTDNVTLAAGSGITLSPAGNTLTIASTATNPDANAFQRQILVFINDGETFAVGDIAVPSGKRLVIEYLTVATDLNDDFHPIEITTTVAGAQVTHSIASPDQGIKAIDRKVRIFSDGNVHFRVQKLDFSEVDTGARYDITVSGHLVDLP